MSLDMCDQCFFYALVDGVSRAPSFACAARKDFSIPVVIGFAPPNTRRAIRSISLSVVTASRRSSSVACPSPYSAFARLALDQSAGGRDRPRDTNPEIADSGRRRRRVHHRTDQAGRVRRVLSRRRRQAVGESRLHRRGRRRAEPRRLRRGGPLGRRRAQSQLPRLERRRLDEVKEGGHVGRRRVVLDAVDCVEINSICRR